MGNTEAQDREAAAWTSFGLYTVLGSVGAAVSGLKWWIFCLLPGVLAGVLAIVTAEEDRQLAGPLGVVLGSVGAVVLGLPCWVLSWILPIVGFVTMETWKPVLLGEPIVLLCLERVVLIVGVAVLGLKWMLALPVAIVVITAAIDSDSLKLVVPVGIVGMAVLGLKWGLAVLGLKWILAIAGLLCSLVIAGLLCNLAIAYVASVPILVLAIYFFGSWIT